MDTSSAQQLAAPYRAPLSAASLLAAPRDLANAALAWSETRQVSNYRSLLSVTFRGPANCLLTSDVLVMLSDETENEWAIDTVTGPELDGDSAALLCADLKRWSACVRNEGPQFKDIASCLEVRS